jgi:mycofactocin precursor
MNELACVRSETTPDSDEAITEGDVAVESDLLEDDLLVEDVSIDGMCGVY